MQYRLELKHSVLKDIRRIPEVMLRGIRQAIEVLSTDPFPRGCEKIRGYEGYYKIRIGRYRVVYHCTTKLRRIMIIKVGHRKDVYRFLRG